MTRLRENAAVLRYAGLCSFQDYFAIYSPGVWLSGWFLRVLAQVMFFSFIGRLLGSDEQVEFLLVGNAVLVAAGSSMTAIVSTIWERWAGTLPLLVAAPSSPLLVLMGRSVHWIANGLLSTLGSLLIVAPLFGVRIPWPHLGELVLLVLLVTTTSYFAATFLGALVLRIPSAGRTVANVARLTMMAVCGVSVPREFLPEVLERAAALLPLTHGLEAIRALFDAAPAGVILENVAAEVAVGLGWLVLSLLTFDRLADAGRRDGSIVFTDS